MTTIQERLEAATASHETAALRMNQLLDQLDGWSRLPSITHFGVDTGEVNALVCAVEPPIAAYVDGQVFEITPANTTTAVAPTMNINGLGAKSIVYPDNSPIAPGDIVENAKMLCAYDTALGKVVLLSRGRAPGLSVRTATVGGTANAITIATMTPSIGGSPLSVNDMIGFTAISTNTGPVSFEGIPVTGIDGAALAGGEIIAGNQVLIAFNGAAYNLITWKPSPLTPGISTNFRTFNNTTRMRVTGIMPTVLSGIYNKKNAATKIVFGGTISVYNQSTVGIWVAQITFSGQSVRLGVFHGGTTGAPAAVSFFGAIDGLPAGDHAFSVNIGRSTSAAMDMWINPNSTEDTAYGTGTQSLLNTYEVS